LSRRECDRSHANLLIEQSKSESRATTARAEVCK
jgi:hypothetical protein